MTCLHKAFVKTRTCKKSVNLTQGRKSNKAHTRFLFRLGKGRKIPPLERKFFSSAAKEVSPPAEDLEKEGTVAFFSGCTTEFAYPEVGLT